MRGAQLKAEYARLMQLHRCRPISREPLPLFEATSGPVVVEGVCSSSAIDAERMSFKANSLSWGELSTIPLLLRHAGERVGQIMQLDYSAGMLRIKAKVEDETARRQPAFSIAAQIIDSEVRNADSPSAWHFVVSRAQITEVSLTDRPSNAAAVVLSRRDVRATDTAYDDLIGSINRLRSGLEAFVAGTIKSSEPESASPLTLGPAPARIYGTVPLAAMRPRPTSFSSMVAQLKG
ncbi:hypothetical protein ACT4MK_18215 [Bradyrhizobium barranii]|uniref:hypothetical protein n=1 Tax=Bradyrhizobium barranii TaxID=2992140 RepID=UPI0040336661